MLYIKETKYYKLKSNWFFTDKEKIYGNHTPRAPWFSGNSSLESQVTKDLPSGYTLVSNGYGPFREYLSDELHCFYSIKHKTTMPEVCQCIVCKMINCSDKEFLVLKEEWHTHPLSDCLPKERSCIFSKTEPVDKEDIPIQGNH